MPTFEPADDLDLRTGIGPFYHSLVSAGSIREPVVLRLPTKHWISANALNILLTFIEAVLHHDPDARIFLDLLDSSSVGDVPPSLTEPVAKKLIFYESMELVDLLRRRRVVVRPSRDALIDLQERLAAHKTPRQFSYSTRMLALSPLVETDEEQFALTARIRTLTGILYKNLFGREDLQDLEDAAKQIMFELVKNIYQHSELPPDYVSRARGFACAQVNKFPLIRSSEYPQELIEATLEHIRPPIARKQWQWLSVTVNDFGVGISNKVAAFLRCKAASASAVRVGRFQVTNEQLHDHALLLQIAATTDFSTKSFRVPEDTTDRWQDREQVYTLAGRGFGLVYCVGFIARTFGRMRIRSGPAALDLFPRAEAVIRREVWSNVQLASQVLQDEFPFDVTATTLHDAAAAFPGTQILIEIPVEVWRGDGWEDRR